MKYYLFIHKDHGKRAVVQEDFEKNIDSYLDMVQRYMEQNKNNRVELKLKMWRDFFNGDDFIEYMAEDNNMSRRNVYKHIETVTSVLKRHPDCSGMWRKI